MSERVGGESDLPDFSDHKMKYATVRKWKLRAHRLFGALGLCTALGSLGAYYFGQRSLDESFAEFAETEGFTPGELRAILAIPAEERAQVHALLGKQAVLELRMTELAEQRGVTGAQIEAILAIPADEMAQVRALLGKQALLELQVAELAEQRGLTGAQIEAILAVPAQQRELLGPFLLGLSEQELEGFANLATDIGLDGSVERHAQLQTLFGKEGVRVAQAIHAQRDTVRTSARNAVEEMQLGFSHAFTQYLRSNLREVLNDLNHLGSHSFVFETRLWEAASYGEYCPRSHRRHGENQKWRIQLNYNVDGTLSIFVIKWGKDSKGMWFRCDDDPEIHFMVEPPQEPEAVQVP